MTSTTAVWPVRPTTSDDKDQFMSTALEAFGTLPGAWKEPAWTAFASSGGSLVAHEQHDHSRVVGTSTYVPVKVAFPSDQGAVSQDVHGVTWVAVRQDRRRQGVARALMTAQLAWARDQGFSWSALTSSDPAIYGRYGYGCATEEHTITVTGGRFSSVDIDQTPYTFDLLPTTDQAYELHHQVVIAQAQQVAGTVTLDPEFFRARYAQDHHTNLHRAQPRMAILRKNGTPVAASLIERPAPPENPDEQVMQGFVSATDEARVLLAKYISSFDLVKATKIRGTTTDDALVWAGDGPRALARSTRDGLWMRPVDLAKALGGLFWRQPVTMVVEITDPVPGTPQKVVVEATEPGTAMVEPTDAAPDVKLPSATVGALSLGGLSPVAATRRGPFTEHRQGALTELATALRGIMEPSITNGF